MATQEPYELVRKIATHAPACLSVWQTGRAALPAVLFEISRRRLTDKVERVRAGGPFHDDGAIGARWASVAGYLTEWSFKYGDQHSEGRELTERDCIVAVDLAERWRAVDIALNAGRLNRAKLSMNSRGIWVDPFSDPRVEALDILLERATVSATPVPEVGPDLRPAIDYLNSMRSSMPGQRGIVPRWIMSLFVRHRQNFFAEQAWELPLGTTLGSLTLGDAIPMLGALKGISDLSVEVFSRYPSFAMANPVFTRGDLEKMVARYATTKDKVAAFLDLFTYAGEQGQSPLSLPLISWADWLIVNPNVLHDALTERMILRAASSDPSRSGKLGVALGNLAGQWADCLKTLAGTELAEGVKVLSDDNRTLGDLDIVAFDRDRMRGLIVEAKWPVDARTLSDVWKQQSAIDKGRGQIQRLQKDIRSGARVKLPRKWPAFDDVQWKWVVGTARFLDSRLTESPIPCITLDLVKSLLPAMNLQELIERLDNIRLPQEGKHFRMGWERVKVGGCTIHVRTIEMLSM
jgi:hypothetical protein